MRHLKTAVHPDIEHLDSPSIKKRNATRAICVNGESILLMHTERYDDYTLPGGGVDDGEDLLDAFVRELEEETGANNIRLIKPYGIYEEFRPWYKDDADVMHMISYCYTCHVDSELGQNKLESYEQTNGMKPMWVNIFDAIAHNQRTIANSDKKGLSIERETFLLELIAKEIL